MIISFSAATAGYFAGSKSVKDDAAGLPGVFGGIGGSITTMLGAAGAALSAGALVAGLKAAGEEVCTSRTMPKNFQFLRKNYPA